jgi:hypothetical protein
MNRETRLMTGTIMAVADVVLGGSGASCPWVGVRLGVAMAALVDMREGDKKTQLCKENEMRESQKGRLFGHRTTLII